MADAAMADAAMADACKAAAEEACEPCNQNKFSLRNIANTSLHCLNFTCDERPPPFCTAVDCGGSMLAMLAAATAAAAAAADDCDEDCLDAFGVEPREDVPARRKLN